MAGNALAIASGAKPISRRTAEARIEEFLARASAVNADESFPHRVGKVVVFGSYLGDRDRIGDVDLAIRLDRRPRYANAWPETLLAHAEAALWRGRRFRSFIDALAWAETEVKTILRGGVRPLSLHDWNREAPWLSKAPHRVLYEEPEPVLEAAPGKRRPKKTPSGDCPF